MHIPCFHVVESTNVIIVIHPPIHSAATKRLTLVDPPQIAFARAANISSFHCSLNIRKFVSQKKCRNEETTQIYKKNNLFHSIIDGRQRRAFHIIEYTLGYTYRLVDLMEMLELYNFRTHLSNKPDNS